MAQHQLPYHRMLHPKRRHLRIHHRHAVVHINVMQPGKIPQKKNVKNNVKKEEKNNVMQPAKLHKMSKTMSKRKRKTMS
jgi:hypothetical protein